MQFVRFFVMVMVLSLLGLPGAARGAEMGTEVTYQGNLTDGGGPVTGQVDMKFTLYDAVTLGNQVGTTAIFDGQGGNGAPVVVADGLLIINMTNRFYDLRAVLKSTGATLGLKGAYKYRRETDELDDFEMRSRPGAGAHAPGRQRANAATHGAGPRSLPADPGPG